MGQKQMASKSSNKEKCQKPRLTRVLVWWQTGIFGGERKHKRCSLMALPWTEAIRRCRSTVTFSWW